MFDLERKMDMKKLISLILGAGMMLSGISAFAQDVTVLKNGNPIEFDVAPFIDNDRTLVPMRAVFEAVGASVEWIEETKTVMAVYEVEGEKRFVVLQIDNESAFVNEEQVTLDVPAKIVSDRTFVPLRFVMESLGYEITWDGDTYTANIVSE